jgi:glycosyltransferase involved in cell wall biosynthesis
MTLRIAWLGGAPMEEAGGAPGVVRDLLDGLAREGHQIDCYFPGAGNKLPPRIAAHENLTVTWGSSKLQGNRWYNKIPVGTFASGLSSRALSSLRLRREIARRHREQPYDLIYQNQWIESVGVPSSVLRSAPLVVRPDTESASELRCLIAERELSFRCQPRYIFFVVAAILFLRAQLQRVMIRRASLLVCISRVFRDHLVEDYDFPRGSTAVVPNPVRLERFTFDAAKPPGKPPIVLVPVRVSVRKGVEDVIEIAKLLRDRGVQVRLRIVGGASLWSDYTKLLEDLPSETAEYAGRVAHGEMPAEYANSDMMLLASKFDPCPMAVLEGLSCGVPIVATTEVGSTEGVDDAVAVRLAPGDVEGMATAIEQMLGRIREQPAQMRSLARAEAERLFAPEVICRQLSAALEALVANGSAAANGAGSASRNGAVTANRPGSRI